MDFLASFQKTETLVMENFCPDMIGSQMCEGWALNVLQPPLSKPQALGSQGSLALPPGITNSIM